MPFILTNITDGNEISECAVNPDTIFAVARTKKGNAVVLAIGGAKVETTTSFEDFLEQWNFFDLPDDEPADDKPPFNVNVKL